MRFAHEEEFTGFVQGPETDSHTVSRYTLAAMMAFPATEQDKDVCLEPEERGWDKSLYEYILFSNTENKDQSCKWEKNY